MSYNRKSATTANRTQPSGAQRQSAVRNAFGYLKMEAEGAKIGTLIRRIRDIATTAGGGVFIFYKNDTDAESMPLWMREKSHLKPMEFQGAGWYIWAFNAPAIKRAEVALLAEEQTYLANAREFQERHAVAKPVERPVFKLERDDSVPVVKRPVTGIWANGPPKVVASQSEEVVQLPVKAQQIVRLMPLPVLIKREKVALIEDEPIDIAYQSQPVACFDSWEDDYE